jgi:hypothetical protein
MTREIVLAIKVAKSWLARCFGIVVAGVYPLQINFSFDASQICPSILR